jgi:hypothetical protein
VNLQKSWTLSLAAALGAAFALAGCENSDDNGPFNAPVNVNSYAVTSSGRLLSFDTAFSAHANAATLSGIGAGETVVGSAIRPASGALFVLTRNGTSGKVYTVNTTSGAASNGVALVADTTDITAPYTGLAGTAFGVDFNPVPDRLRVVSGSGQNLRINVDTGAVTTDTNLTGANAAASGAAYTNAFASACRTALYVVDPATDTLYLQNPPNDGVLQKIGALGVDVTSVGGLDIRTAADGSNTLFGALIVGGKSQLYSISTMTGAASLLGAFDVTGSETIVGFATNALPASTTVTQAAGELIGLTTTGSLVSFNRGSPAKLCTTAAVAGIDSGDSLVGIDLRPADGKIYGVGKLGSLYSVTSAGAATKACALVADPADTTLPYAGLTGSNFGLNFNPVPDRLRVVSDGTQNLRINPNPNASSQCLVTTDAVLSGTATPSVTAASYTNAIPGTASTALYAIDTGSDSLVRIGTDPATGGACPADTGNPNCGVVTTVGSLGITGDVAATAGLEIDGKVGTAFGAFAAGAATSSTLYTVNLATGAATSVGVIGGGSILKSLTLNLNSAVKVYGLTADGHLLSFGLTANAFTPNAVTDVAISGLSTGDTLVGIDFRPLNGVLYGIGSGGRLYSISTTTGAATSLVTFTADPTDTTAPTYTSLNPTALYAVDFNPTVDRIRVINNANDNFRINPFTGIVIGDGTINGGTGIVAAAYTNSFIGSTATTLYDLNSTTLYTQNPPNNGTLVSVGTTGVTASGDIGFDIAGGSNGLVLAAIRTATGTGPSDLYRINLSTGAATPISAAAGAATIGTASTQQILGLAIEVK